MVPEVAYNLEIYSHPAVRRSPGTYAGSGRGGVVFGVAYCFVC